MKEVMIDVINKEIEKVKAYYEENGWNNEHEKHLAKINGMVQMLIVSTKKDYYYDNNGVHERHGNK
jgi:hypothetical protein